MCCLWLPAQTMIDSDSSVTLASGFKFDSLAIDSIIKTNAHDTLSSSAKEFKRTKKQVHQLSDSAQQKKAITNKFGKEKITAKTQKTAKKAALYGLACPGLGQIYMRKYWKLPIVYGLLGGGLYFVVSQGKQLKTFNGYLRDTLNNRPIPEPYNQLGPTELQTYRDYYRKNTQLASFATLFIWGLGILDAAVDAHMSKFDISDNLTLEIAPKINTVGNQYYTGLSLNLTLK